MNDKIVTHADLGDLLDLRSHCADFDSDEAERKVEMLDRLIAAAEADAPPLPEGWVLHTTPAGSRAVFWHRDGYLYQWDDDEHSSRPVQPFRSSVTTPLRPTVTPADVEKAVRAVEALEAKAVVDNKAYVRAAFAAVGIEVRP